MKRWHYALLAAVITVAAVGLFFIWRRARKATAALQAKANAAQAAQAAKAQAIGAEFIRDRFKGVPQTRLDPSKQPDDRLAPRYLMDVTAPVAESDREDPLSEQDYEEGKALALASY